MTETQTIRISPRDLARKISRMWELHPELHDQNMWGDVIDDVESPLTINDLEKEDCGTRMCAAGTAAFLTGNADFRFGHTLALNRHGYNMGDTWLEIGSKLLGIDTDDGNTLFYSTTNQQARVAMRHLAEGKALDWDDINEEARFS